MNCLTLVKAFRRLRHTRCTILRHEFSIIIVISICVFLIVLFPNDAYGLNISVTKGSSVPGCEKTNSCYTPGSASTSTGTTVTWTNNDSAFHTVTSGDSSTPDGLFDSGLMKSGSSFSFKFDTPGTYEYFCMVHPWQTGKITMDKSSSKLPVAINSGPSTANVGQQLKFDGSKSYDPDGGEIIQYSWTFGDSGAGSAGRDSSVSYSYSSPGIYKVYLTVIDDERTTSPQSNVILVTVSAPELPVNFEIEIDPQSTTIVPGDIFPLSVRGVLDGNDVQITVDCKTDSRDIECNFATGDPHFRPATSVITNDMIRTGSYGITVTGHFENYDSSKTLFVNVNESQRDYAISPISNRVYANIGESTSNSIFVNDLTRNTGKVNLNCHSDDPTITCSMFQSSVLADSTVSLNIHTQKNTIPKSYEIFVDANSNGLIRSASFELIVEQTPPSDFDYTVSVIKQSAMTNPGTSVNVPVRIQQQSGDNPEEVLLKCESESNKISCNAPYSVTVSDTIILEIISDDSIEAGKYSITIQGIGGKITRQDQFILEINQQPIAKISDLGINDDTLSQIQFSSDGSRDPDGDIVTFQWDFGDGQSSTKPNPTHSYSNPGTYLVTLTVYDNLQGIGKDTFSRTIVVPSPTNSIPTEVILVSGGIAGAVGFSAIAIKQGWIKLEGKSGDKGSGTPNPKQVDVKFEIKFGVEKNE